jgi:hypothetical protein
VTLLISKERRNREHKAYLKEALEISTRPILKEQKGGFK